MYCISHEEPVRDAVRKLLQVTACDQETVREILNSITIIVMFINILRLKCVRLNLQNIRPLAR